MNLACIIGWPVAGSLSPRMHNAAFAALGLEWTYVPLAVREEAIADAVGLLRLLDVRGANVTIPHKRAIVSSLDALAGDAAAVGAVNTLVREGDRFVGHNTDGEGFLRALAAEGWSPDGARALVLGAGGAARAVAYALARAGARVSVAARRPERAGEVASLARGIEAAEWEGLPAADLVVQATPARTGLPVEQLALGPEVVAVDLLYLPPETPFLAAARRAGARASDGLGMLLHQAALSFELWTGRPAPLGAMASALSASR